MINTFKKYNLLGLACLPTDENKMPVSGLSTWKGGVTDESLYKDCFGIGIICGEISGGLECIDFDNHFGDAKEIISKFVQLDEVNEIYRKYNIPIESTISGGYHFIYRCSKIEGNKKLARRPKMDEKTRKWIPDGLIETRGEGGYFVSDPTPGYKFVRNSFETIPTITTDERDVLISACKTFNTWADKIIESGEEDANKPGNIYNEKSESISDARRCLIDAGWNESRPGIWQRPGKKKGITATFGIVAPNVFYNFSSSAYPFELNRGYKPFQVVGLLKYGGDFSRLASDLAEKYHEDIPTTKPKKKPELSPVILDDLLSKAFIDIDIPKVKPPIVLFIGNKKRGTTYIEKQRLFTLGNFSAITGKGKSKKTFLTSLMLAAVSKNDNIQNKFFGNLPANKRQVLLFDTEQSGYDAWITSKRVRDLVGYDIPNFGAFDLREYDPLQRCQIIDHAITKYSDGLGFVVIDGIADLAKAINDEEEATRVGTLLMKWTKINNIHIVAVIHQNKNDDFATGHLGSMIIKKSEAVISVKKDPTDRDRSVVSCDNIRGTMDFDDFEFEIDKNNWLPVIDYSDIKTTVIDFYEK